MSDYNFEGKRFLPYSDETSGMGGRARPTTYGVYDELNNRIHSLRSAESLKEAREQAIKLNNDKRYKQCLKNKCMSDKQQSPISKAIAWCDETVESMERVNSALLRTKRQRIDEVKGVKNYLELLAEEEKKFAEDAYGAGCAVTAQIWDDEYTKKVTEPKFPDYYKKYEL